MFLDRDGTINTSPPAGEYLTRATDVALIDGVAGAIRRLNQAEIWVGIVTNQRGIALGLMTLEELDSVHKRLFDELEITGAKIDAVYVCPHEIGVCRCRKPLPGLLLQAQRDVDGLDFALAAMIGDSPSDVAAGRAVGATAILLDPADGGVAAANGGDEGADHRAPSLTAALDWLSVPVPAAAGPG